MEYWGFAVVELKLDSDKFWKMTYQELWILMLRFWKEVENRKAEVKERTWILADIKAHIANFSMYKKRDGLPWTFRDFVKNPAEFNIPEEEKAKQKPPSLKEAKQILGSKFSLN